MQKKGWAVGMEMEDAIIPLTEHLSKGAAWSGDELVYLNAVWEACAVVAREHGYLDAE